MIQSLLELVVWNMNFIFHFIYGIILPIDFHIFQRGGSTTNQIKFNSNKRRSFANMILNPSKSPLTYYVFFPPMLLHFAGHEF